jgi:uncharacterized protein YndB with AHSA1/START domain
MTPFDVPIGVRVTRRLAAAREHVFDAFTVPALRRRWWAARQGDACTLCEIDARVGGSYRINMISKNSEFITVGTFLEVDRPQRLVFTWSWEVPAGGPENSVVTIDLEALAPTLTELTLAHDRLATDELRAMHAEGWGLCLDRLAAQIDGITKSPEPPAAPKGE